VNSMIGRYMYLALIRARGSTHGIRCCDFSVVGYLYVNAVCDKASE
jgi:hypothetical protein